MCVCHWQVDRLSAGQRRNDDRFLLINRCCRWVLFLSFFFLSLSLLYFAQVLIVVSDPPRVSARQSYYVGKEVEPDVFRLSPLIRFVINEKEREKRNGRRRRRREWGEGRRVAD